MLFGKLVSPHQIGSLLLFADRVPGIFRPDRVGGPAHFQNSDLAVGVAVGHHDRPHRFHVPEGVPAKAAKPFGSHHFSRGHFWGRFVAGRIQT